MGKKIQICRGAMMSELSKIIDDYIKENDLALREFAQRCNLSHSYIAKLRKGFDPRTKSKIEPTIGTIKKIATAMGIDVKELLIKSKYIDNDTQPAEIPEELRELGIEYVALAKDIERSKLTPEEIRELMDFANKIKNKEKQHL